MPEERFGLPRLEAVVPSELSNLDDTRLVSSVPVPSLKDVIGAGVSSASVCLATSSRLECLDRVC